MAKALAVSGRILAQDSPGEALEPLAEAIHLLTPFFSGFH
jgi:hypothetical protein